MRRNFIAKLSLPVLATFALAACGSAEAEAVDGEDGEAVSVEDIAEELSDAITPSAGLYRSTQEFLEFDIPGMEDGMGDMMRGIFESAAGEENTYCVTEEDAAGGPDQMLAGMAESDCTVSRFDVSGGTIDAALQCAGDEGVVGDITLNGTMGAEGAEMVMSVVTELPGVGEGTIRMRVTSERIGDCP